MMKIYRNTDQIEGEKPVLTPFPADGDRNKGSVLIFPGGGYEHVSLLKEGSDIALSFNAEGFNAFVLDYRVSPFTGKDFLMDAVWAVRTVKEFIRKNGFRNERLAVMGFSAGGHLALMETQHWNETEAGSDDISRIDARPDALLLCYPVVTFEEPYAHQGCRKNFLGKSADDPELIRKYSAEKHITSSFPPVFAWHCEADRSVPVENSLMLRDALDSAGVENRVVIYPDGAHGLGLARDDRTISGWFHACVGWLESVFSE